MVLPTGVATAVVMVETGFVLLPLIVFLHLPPDRSQTDQSPQTSLTHL
jgi:hypothetical protein